MEIVRKEWRSGIEYCLLESILKVEEMGFLKVFGITVSDTTTCSVVEDISPEAESVSALFEQIVEGKLSPLHLYDVVEDFLS